MSKLIWGRSPVTLFYILAGRPYSRTPSLPARQLGDLNEVAARVVQLGDGRAGYLGRRHGELGAARFDALVVALDVVGVEHDRGPALLELVEHYRRRAGLRGAERTDVPREGRER